MKILLFLFLIFSSFFSTSSLEARDTAQRLLLANRWYTLEQYFQNRKPRNAKEYYAKGMAILNSSKKTKKIKKLRAFTYFLRALNVSCPSISTQRKDKNKLFLQERQRFVSCMKKYSNLRLRSRAKRVISWQASLEAEKLKLNDLALAFIQFNNLEKKDALQPEIFLQRLKLLIKTKNYKKAYLLSQRKRFQDIQSPMSQYYRAVSYKYNQLDGKAKKIFIKVLSDTSKVWLRKSIYQSMKNFYPKVFTKDSRFTFRFSEFLTKEKLKKLKKKYKSKTIVETSTIGSLLGDGIFFIKTKQSDRILNLSAKHYLFLYNNNYPLRVWIQELEKQEKTNTIIKLLKPFEHSLEKSSRLWFSYIKALEKKNKKKYFDNLLHYLAIYPYHTAMMDRLLLFLLGDKETKIQWAPMSAWEKAKQKLRKTEASGRFYYWLKRYYQNHNKKEKLKDLEKKFYWYSPGSLYNNENWQQISNRYCNEKCRNKQKQIRSYKEYLLWLAKYGNFAKVKVYKKQIHPHAKLLAKQFKHQKQLKDKIIIQLFQLGSWQKGVNLYRKKYQEKISRKSLLLNLVKLAYQNRIYNVQIYFLRRLLWEEQIPIDPFSLPKIFNQILYPRPYLNIVRKYARKYKLSTYVAYSLIRQESLFREGAVSRSNAQGLMQILPTTGKWLAKKILKNKKFHLMQPDANIHLGSYYFYKLLKKYKQDFRWAAIAYNGGPGNLKKWEKKYFRDDFYLFLEKIPNTEARNYCRITFQNYLHYTSIYRLSL